MTTPRKLAPLALVGVACLLVGSTGGAVAGRLVTSADIKNNTITSADIKQFTITGADVKTNSLRGGKLKGNTVGGGKIRDESLTGADVDESSLGQVPLALDAASAQSVGADGVATGAIQEGAVVASKLGPIVLRTSDVLVAPNTARFRAVACLAGEVPIGGGMYWNDVAFTNANSRDLHVTYSQATSTGWAARGFNGTADPDVTLQVQVYCLQ